MTNPICAVCADDATAKKLSRLMIAGADDDPGKAKRFWEAQLWEARKAAK